MQLCLFHTKLNQDLEINWFHLFIIPSNTKIIDL